jgi:hypothetical protein
MPPNSCLLANHYLLDSFKKPLANFDALCLPMAPVATTTTTTTTSCSAMNDCQQSFVRSYPHPQPPSLMHLLVAIANITIQTLRFISAATATTTTVVQLVHDVMDLLSF